jgi:hypothetical protein
MTDGRWQNADNNGKKVRGWEGEKKILSSKSDTVKPFTFSLGPLTFALYPVNTKF